ncbi:MAG: Gfo/Idh/MocA family oxidoreductase [Acidobacteria bacterium]|nr:Gfo/Idh/MocA family oxidoreductase [Acidobacteriota bacterium]
MGSRPSGEYTYERREFMTSAGLAAAALAAAGHTPSARGYPANETVNIACIGPGGRGQQLLHVLKKMPAVRVAAVCDIWDVHLQMGKELADPKAFVTKNYRAILDRKDIDGVLITTPNHWHVPMTIDACAAGKDVYVEKPLTLDLSEGDAVLRAEKEYNRVVQVGMQQRSTPQFQKAYEIVKSGVLGKIHKVHLTWNRNRDMRPKGPLGIDPKTVDWKQFLGRVKDQPFDEYRFRNHRWFWDFGGGILTDLAVHFIDVANWFLDLDYPAMATSAGDQFLMKGVWELPDTIQTLYRHPKQGAQVYFEGTWVSARNGAMLEFMGTEATLYLDRGRYEIYPERGRSMPYSELVLAKGPRGLDNYKTPLGDNVGDREHLTNWIDCIRRRTKPNTPAEAGVRAAAAAHLGNIAYRTGKVAEWRS